MTANLARRILMLVVDIVDERHRPTAAHHFPAEFNHRTDCGWRVRSRRYGGGPADQRFPQTFASSLR
jgi:hypothetical protein